MGYATAIVSVTNPGRQPLKSRDRLMPEPRVILPATEREGSVWWRRWIRASSGSSIGRLYMSTEILETAPLYQEWIRAATERGVKAGIE
jgi:hypothetical protein